MSSRRRAAPADFRRVARAGSYSGDEDAVVESTSRVCETARALKRCSRLAGRRRAGGRRARASEARGLPLAEPCRWGQPTIIIATRAEPEGARESPTDFTFLTVRARARARARERASVLVSRLIPVRLPFRRPRKFRVSMSTASTGTARLADIVSRSMFARRTSHWARPPSPQTACHLKAAVRIQAKVRGDAGAQAPARLWHHAGALRERRRGATTKRGANNARVGEMEKASGENHAARM